MRWFESMVVGCLMGMLAGAVLGCEPESRPSTSRPSAFNAISRPSGAQSEGPSIEAIAPKVSSNKVSSSSAALPVNASFQSQDKKRYFVPSSGDASGDASGDTASASKALSPDVVAKIGKLMPEAVLKASLVGALQEMEHEAIALLKRTTQILEGALPDCDRVLAEMTDLRDATRPAAETAGKILREQRAVLRKTKGLKAYQDRMTAYYAAEIAAYEKAIARFELLATNEQLLRFNALIKGLTAPLSD